MKDGSFALIFWKNKILLFHRDNIPTIPNPDCWHLPGGGIENGETHLETIKRELKEEVSYVPEKIIFISKITNPNNISFLYTAFVSDKEAKLFKHGQDEGQEIKFFTIEEALNIKLTPVLSYYLDKFRKEIETAIETKIPPKFD